MTVKVLSLHYAILRIVIQSVPPALGNSDVLCIMILDREQTQKYYQHMIKVGDCWFDVIMELRGLSIFFMIICRTEEMCLQCLQGGLSEWLRPSKRDQTRVLHTLWEVWKYKTPDMNILWQWGYWTVLEYNRWRSVLLLFLWDKCCQDLIQWQVILMKVDIFQPIEES